MSGAAHPGPRGSDDRVPTRRPGQPPTPVPDPYVVERVRDALAADDRVGELGLSVEITALDLIVRGMVSTATRKAGVVPVARDVLGGLGVALTVDDRTEVPPATGAEEEEVVG